MNVPLPVPVACQSFGGWKRSLFGDLYAYGPDAVRFYTAARPSPALAQRRHREGAVRLSQQRLIGTASRGGQGSATGRLVQVS